MVKKDMQYMTFAGLNKKDRLIWILLFSEKETHEIDLAQYVSKMDDRAQFREEIREILKRGKREIKEDRIFHKDDKTIWKLEIKYINNI